MKTPNIGGAGHTHTQGGGSEPGEPGGNPNLKAVRLFERRLRQLLQTPSVFYLGIPRKTFHIEDPLFGDGPGKPDRQNW